MGNKRVGNLNISKSLETMYLVIMLCYLLRGLDHQFRWIHAPFVLCGFNFLPYLTSLAKLCSAQSVAYTKVQKGSDRDKPHVQHYTPISVSFTELSTVMSDLRAMKTHKSDWPDVLGIFFYRGHRLVKCSQYAIYGPEAVWIKFY